MALASLKQRRKWLIIGTMATPWRKNSRKRGPDHHQQRSIRRRSGMNRSLYIKKVSVQVSIMQGKNLDKMSRVTDSANQDLNKRLLITETMTAPLSENSRRLDIDHQPRLSVKLVQGQIQWRSRVRLNLSDLVSTRVTPNSGRM